MTDPIMDMLNEMSDRMARMETKLDRLYKIEEKADQARDVAHEARQFSHTVMKRIEWIENNMAKIWLTLFGSIVSAVAGAIVYFIRVSG